MPHDGGKQANHSVLAKYTASMHTSMYYIVAGFLAATVIPIPCVCLGVHLTPGKPSEFSLAK